MLVTEGRWINSPLSLTRRNREISIQKRTRTLESDESGLDRDNLLFNKRKVILNDSSDASRWRWRSKALLVKKSELRPMLLGASRCFSVFLQGFSLDATCVSIQHVCFMKIYLVFNFNLGPVSCITLHNPLGFYKKTFAGKEKKY